MKQPPKIYMINRDRALQIMWYLDSFYDEFKSVKYEDVRDKITRDEWVITQMYFNPNNYTWDYVIENLKKLRKNEVPYL